MRRVLRDMSMWEILEWISECVPGAMLISIVLTLAASILFDFSLEFSSWSGLLLRFLPGFAIGLMIMLTISYFLGSVLLGLLRLIGLGRP
jgi:hypothetical protein